MAEYEAISWALDSKASSQEESRRPSCSMSKLLKVTHNQRGQTERSDRDLEAKRNRSREKVWSIWRKHAIFLSIDWLIWLLEYDSTFFTSLLEHWQTQGLPALKNEALVSFYPTWFALKGMVWSGVIRLSSQTAGEIKNYWLQNSLSRGFWFFFLVFFYYYYLLLAVPIHSSPPAIAGDRQNYQAKIWIQLKTTVKKQWVGIHDTQEGETDTFTCWSEI